MVSIESNPFNIINIGEKEYFRLSTYIADHFGIRLPPNKKIVLQCRLQRRLKALQCHSFSEYVDYFFSPKGQIEEVPVMIDAVSTNKTDFFREPAHFNFLLNQGIQQYLARTGKTRLNIWSAGCSSGEEPYSIAMLMNEYSLVTNLDYYILATDIASGVLQQAEGGIYAEDKTDPVPLSYKKKYLLKGRNSQENKVKIVNELRNKIEFRTFNLINKDYSHLGRFDMIFCRNVLIYFDREVQFQIIKQFCSVLAKGGYLFLGHSESLAGFSLPLEHIKPTIFRKKD